MKKEEIIFCVGDSITYGYELESKKDSFPSILNDLLGESYTVYNGGITGMTVHGYPYTSSFKKSMDVNPDIVIIQLGSNDSGQYMNREIFKKEYEKLLDLYSCTLVLCTPPCPFYIDGNRYLNYNVNEENLLEIVDVIQEIGMERNLKVVDLYSLTSNHPEWFTLDGIHPNKEGSKEIAKLIYLTVFN